ncbi:GNAT family N-acetyltransferase [Enterococcus sp. 2201sp1_2201st1_B8_2201SCRN_220225]|uniref:GNAT family N-acetyltransferase n=1 Tax=unclassified Enterococcus TaxID=2608891 RepID=UPI0034A1D0B6
MNLIVKTFPQLSTTELYEILKVRSQIFVVEQNCAYQDIDGQDQESLHLFFQEEGHVLAYLRAFLKEPGVVQMGRVLTVTHGQGLGKKLLASGIKEIKAHFHARQIVIEAQCYAIGFYEKADFVVCSEEFLEDGIPHVKMGLSL